VSCAPAPAPARRTVGTPTNSRHAVPLGCPPTYPVSRRFACQEAPADGLNCPTSALHVETRAQPTHPNDLSEDDRRTGVRRSRPARCPSYHLSTRIPSRKTQKMRATPYGMALIERMSGGVLLSHAVPRAVPSALQGLASGFGMGPGVSPVLWPPKLYGDVGRPHLGNRTVNANEQEVCGQVLGLLVPVSSTCCHASTSGLSTQSSTGGLTRLTLWETSSRSELPA
jgi:hypothetical protein